MRLDIRDVKLVKRIMFDKSIVDVMSDDHAIDFAKKAGKYFEINSCKTLLGVPTIYLLSPNKYTLFMLTMRTFTLFEVHTMILKEGRGKNAVENTIKTAKWMFENSTCEKIITYIPKFNKSARLFAKFAGMKDEGVCTKSFKKNGILHDQWTLGLEKETLCQH